MELLEKVKLHRWYYLIVVMGYILTLATRAVHPGMLATALLLLMWGLWAVGAMRTVFSQKLDTMDLLAMMYLVYSLLSCVWCIRCGMPAGVCVGEFSTGILTMVFYGVARTLGDEDTDRFYYWFIGAIYLVCFVGLILYIWAPQFYLDYLLEYSYISKADAATMRIRMISVIGSIQLGYLAVAGMLASAHLLLKNEGRKGKILLFAGCLFAFLSNQRSAMVVALLVLIYVNLLVFFTFRLLPKKYFFIECAGIAVLFVGLCVAAFSVILKIWWRLESLPGAIGQRSDQWVGAMNNMCSLWLGNGLGANGHRANGLTDHMIADGGIAKLFVEMGIIGFSIFLYLMILAFKKGVKNLALCAAEVGIVAITLLQSVGSNILSFQLTTPIFWFALGRIAAMACRETEPFNAAKNNAPGNETSEAPEDEAPEEEAPEEEIK